tara:strand:- start:3002 stop:3178 length:177 start_codon:yes stop_codon:yes gene_type:complete
MARYFANLDEVTDYINHIVNMVGVDHAEFGSDFDGVGNNLSRWTERRIPIPGPSGGAA